MMKKAAIAAVLVLALALLLAGCGSGTVKDAGTGSSSEKTVQESVLEDTSSDFISETEDVELGDMI